MAGMVKGSNISRTVAWESPKPFVCTNSHSKWVEGWGQCSGRRPLASSRSVPVQVHNLARECSATHNQLRVDAGEGSDLPRGEARLTGRGLVYGKFSAGLLGMLLAIPHASGGVLRQSGPADPPVTATKTSAGKKAAATKAGTTATSKAATGAKAKKKRATAKGPTAKGTRITRKSAA